MAQTVERAHEEISRVEGDLGSLPTVFGPLFGRDDDLDRAVGLIEAGVRPVLTVVGPGGVGKTRLAIALAERLAASYADGVRFVGLSGERNVSDAEARVRQALGATAAGAEPVRAWLASRDLVLILDNLEQIPGAGDLIAGIMPRSGGSRLVVTSRGPLHIAAEQVLRLEPLRSGPRRHDAGEERGPAVALFVDSASAADADYAPDEAELDAIGELCRRLDGLPLAIRLAAQRRRLLGVGEMLRRIDNDPTLLAGAGRDLEERQRTIERSIGWSLDLLTDEERVDAHLLSLAPAGWSEPTQAAIEPTIALTTLERLLDLGIVGRVGDRLTMLQTVRDIVSAAAPSSTQDGNRERLIDAVVRDATRLRSLDASPAALIEDANLRHVVHLLADQGDAERLLRFVVVLDTYWTQTGTGAAIAGRLRWALETAALPEAPDQLRALQLVSVASAMAGQPDEGLRIARDMVELSEQRGTVQERVRALNILGGAYLMAHQPGPAYDTFRSALPLGARGGRRHQDHDQPGRRRGRAGAGRRGGPAARAGDGGDGCRGTPGAVDASGGAGDPGRRPVDGETSPARGPRAIGGDAPTCLAARGRVPDGRAGAVER